MSTDNAVNATFTEAKQFFSDIQPISSKNTGCRLMRVSKAIASKKKAGIEKKSKKR
jgi:hypothetical protein